MREGFESGDLRLWQAQKPPVVDFCPVGTHLVHDTGLAGFYEIERASDFGQPFLDGEHAEASKEVRPLLVRTDLRGFTCQPDEVCSPDRCGESGQCQVQSGVSSCACDAGYAGESCRLCATGYERVGGICVLSRECGQQLCSGQGTCFVGDAGLACRCEPGASGRLCENGVPLTDDGSLKAPARIRLVGSESSIEYGETRKLVAEVFGGGNVDLDLRWSIVEGPGILDREAGEFVNFTAPPDGDGVVQATTIQVFAPCCPDEPEDFHLSVVPTASIPITGEAHPLLTPMDQVLVDFMKYRCVGAATLGVSLNGEPIFTRGYGNLFGAPTDDPQFLAECGDQFDISDLHESLELPAPSPVLPETPMRIGSNSKAIGAAVLRQAVKNHIATQRMARGLVAGPEPSDDEIEALLLSEPSNGLLPQPHLDMVNQLAPPPLFLFSQTGTRPNCDGATDPCPFDSTCESTPAGNVCTPCPPGLSGWDCSVVDAFCPTIFGGTIDSRWQDVTLGHLLGHSAGIPRSAPSGFSTIYPNFGLFRGASDLIDWQAEEALLTSETGFAGGSFASEFPNFAGSQANLGPSVFPPRLTVWEVLAARMGACLAYTPGNGSVYSNTGYSVVGKIAELVSGLSFAGVDGKPGLHQGSLLDFFNQDELGLPYPGQLTDEGILFSQNILRTRHPEEPLYRAWDGSSYYQLGWDQKRPYCEPQGNDCEFTSWIENPSPERPRFDWDFNWDSTLQRPSPTLLPFTGNTASSSGSEGALAVEAEAMLRFMAKFWVSGSGSNPRYGETRCPDGNCIWDWEHFHSGARSGTLSYVFQLGGGTKNLTLPPRSASGRIFDDFANLSTVSCELPEGVDVFVAINTTSDRKCAEDDSYTCDAAYDLLSHFVLWGVCQVDWPNNPFELWPPAYTGGG